MRHGNGRGAHKVTAGASGVQRERGHLRRLERVFDTTREPLFLLNLCVRDRRPVLANEAVFRILVSTWRDALQIHGWMIGRYVVMPDHVHFFATRGEEDAKNLSEFMAAWKRWTSRRIREGHLRTFAWQQEFFDHLIRGGESYAEKWEYVRQNPVRAGLCQTPEEWPHQGEVHALGW
jgi:putative transposase